MCRLRIKFKRGEALKYISHLDIIRLWQRAIHRAGIALAYSQGFSPHPRISLAAPLALGITSEAELMDITTVKQVSPHFLMKALMRQLPEGIDIVEAIQIPLTQPSLQAQMRFAEYRVELAAEEPPQEITTAIDKLMAADTFAWQHKRDTGTRSYDLRALVDDLWLEAEKPDGTAAICMRLRCDSNGSGRPEQVALALGFKQPPQSIHRTRLILKSG